MMIINIISVQEAPGPNLGSESELWHENQSVNNSNTEVISDLVQYKFTIVNETFAG